MDILPTKYMKIPAPHLKICDFGFSKSSMLYSKPNINVGSTTYTAPEDLPKEQHNGKVCAVR
uniref:Protein kinase domain-containing protein n=1 Tax=Cucumis melo TaxID=3656 RepID=A0A9I9E5M1_CUCME